MAFIVVLGASALAITACKPKDIEVVQTPALHAEAPTRARLIAAHNERAARLATTWSDGVIELRWTDEKGEHTEQGDVELWQTTGNRTALRISKLGEVLFWLGSKDDQWWLFDVMARDDHVLHRGTHDQAAERLAGLGVKPLALLDLLGLTTIAGGDPSDDAQPARFDPARRKWVVEAAGCGGPMRLYVDPQSLLPSRIELLDSTGGTIAGSELSRYESVPIPGTAIMARPKFPRTIDVHLEHTQSGEMTGDVKIVFNQTLGEIEPKMLNNLFDVERLTAALRPHRVVQAGAAP